MKRIACWSSFVLLGLGCSAGGGSTTFLPTGDGSGTAAAPSSAGSGPGGGLDVPIGGSSSSGVVGAAGDASCAASSKEAPALPLDIFILLDQSGSMQEDGKPWTPTTEALKAWVGNASFAGTGVGLQYFPLGATETEDKKICRVANYVEPEVPIAELPGNAAAIVSSIDSHHFNANQAEDPEHWGTPTRPAIEGVLQHLTPYAAAHPDRKAVLLLATDGRPSDLCAGNDISGIAQVLNAAAAATPPIVTYVIGIGDIENLSQLALAGGTGHDVFLVDASGANTEQEFAAALESIRQLALPCEYPLPEPPQGETLDPSKVNVQHGQNGSSEDSVFFKVASAADCIDGESNWFYDDDASPSAILMCPSACNTLKAGGRIDILFGCDTRERVK